MTRYVPLRLCSRTKVSFPSNESNPLVMIRKVVSFSPVKWYRLLQSISAHRLPKSSKITILESAQPYSPTNGCNSIGIGDGLTELARDNSELSAVIEPARHERHANANACFILSHPNCVAQWPKVLY